MERTLCAIGGGDPEGVTAGVEDDGELLGRSADGEVGVVLELWVTYVIIRCGSCTTLSH